MLVGPQIAAGLAAYVAARVAEPFDWRSANCCHFVAQWMVFAGEPDPMSDLPETPDAAAALRLVRELGNDLGAAVSARLGRNSISATFAQQGDIVLLPGDAGGTGHAVGVCAGLTAIYIDVAGVCVRAPMTEALCAWRLHGDAP